MSDKPSFVFIHGAWHSGATWAKVAPLLEVEGYKVFAPDLPGAGKNVQSPVALESAPFDPAAFATKPSPNATATPANASAMPIH